MGYVLNILFALGTLAVPDSWSRAGERPWVVPLLVLVPYLLGWSARRSFFAGRFRLGTLLERGAALSPMLLQLFAVVALGWLATVERWSGERTGDEGWPDLWMLVGLAPFFLYEAAALDARARCLALPQEAAHDVRSFQVRLFLSALLPFLVYLVVSSLVAGNATLRVQVEEVGLLMGSWTVLWLAFFAYALPFFLRHAWSTAPLEPGPLRATLEEVARESRFRCRELLVWRTGNQMANAAIVGISPRTRLVFFSDLLLAQLGPRELAAVFAHEMGHARRGHVAIFVALCFLFFLGADLALTWSGVSGTPEKLALLAVVLVVGYLVFGFLSRRFELEADLESLRILGESGPLVRALELVTGAHAHERSSWRHFSTRDRVRFLERAETDPVVGVKLRLSLARWRKLGFALFAVAATLELAQLARTWNQDWVRADLRLGRYERAAERAGEPGVDAETAELARLAGTIEPGDREPAALESRALEALEKGELSRARDLLELALLRGREDERTAELELVRDAVQDELLPGTGNFSPSDLPSPWREALVLARGSS